VLLARLVTRVRLKDLVAGQRTLHPIGETLQGLNHPALPIDQGAVTVEAECVEIRKQHVDSPRLLHRLMRVVDRVGGF
jgi:hypothetical protein